MKQCTDKEWKHCQVEKRTCVGCFYKTEEWKDIKEYEKTYQISDFGRVKSLKFGKEKILKLKKNSGGYLEVLLYGKQSKKTYRVHRLVAEAFIPNPNNLPEVNHIDGNKENNNIYNLEWVTGSENKKHAYKTGLMGTTERIRKKCIENGKKTCKAICQFDLNGNFIKKWESQSEASRVKRIHRVSILNCLKNKTKTAGGFIWKYCDK